MTETGAGAAGFVDDVGGTIAATGSGQLQVQGLYTQGAGTTSDSTPGGFAVAIATGGALSYTGSGASSIEDISQPPPRCTERSRPASR